MRVVQPKLQAVAGVQTAEILGGQNFSLRAWLDPQEARGLWIDGERCVDAPCATTTYISAVGNTKGQMVQVTLTSTTNLHSLEEFRNLVVKQVNGGNIRLSDVGAGRPGRGQLRGAASRSTGTTGVFIGIQVAPSANLLTVIKGVQGCVSRKSTRSCRRASMGGIIYDSTDFVNSSIHEVALTLVEALIIVMLVIFAFLGSPRSVLIPVIAIPLSLIGTLAIMLALGFSINLLTLLALVLAIGLVVDDAIIVVENVNRHLEGGMAPLAAAMSGGARARHGPIVAMTVVLLAVYVPIGFQGGLTGALFTEFAFTLAGAVTVSAVIALTLSPMMCSRLLQAAPRGRRGLGDAPRQVHRRALRALRAGTSAASSAACATRRSPPCSWCWCSSASCFLYRSARRASWRPQEDQGFVLTQSTSPPECDPAAQGCSTPRRRTRSSRRRKADTQCSKSMRRASPSPACRLPPRNAAQDGRH